MRLAVHSYAFRALAAVDAFARIRQLGVEAVELWLGHAGEPGGVERALAASALEVVAVGGLGVYAETDLEHVDRAVAVAEELGVATIVGCVSPPLLVEAVRRLPGGIELAVENHWDQPLHRPRDVLRATAAAGCGACLDTGHALLAGIEPERFAAALGDRLRHVHLKDARRATVVERLLGRRGRRRVLARPRPVAPGTGALAADPFARVLVSGGYDGAVTAEYEGHDPDPALRELIRLWRSARSRAG